MVGAHTLIVKKGRPGLFRQIHITAPDAGSADNQLALLANAKAISVGIHDKKFCIDYRPANGDLPIRSHHGCRAAHGTLGRPVYVYNHTVFPQGAQLLV